MSAPRKSRKANARLRASWSACRWLAFAFAFALVPLYRDRLREGVRDPPRAATRPTPPSSRRWTPDTTRTVTVQFDGGVNSEACRGASRRMQPQHAGAARRSSTRPRTSRATTSDRVDRRQRGALRRAQHAPRSTSARPSASASPSRLLRGRRDPRHAGALHRRPGAAGRGEHAHAVLYLLQERRRDRARSALAQPASAPPAG